MRAFVLGLGALLMVSSMAQAQPASPPPPQTNTTAAAPKPPADHVICKREEETGSRLGGKTICKLASVWRTEAEEAKKMASDSLNDVRPTSGQPH